MASRPAKQEQPENTEKKKRKKKVLIFILQFLSSMC